MRQFTRKTAALLLTLALAMSLNVWAFASNYTDMPEDWSKPALESAVENGLMQGSGGRLSPGEKLTRAELAAIVTRAYGASVTTDLSAYAGISASAWYYAELGRAVYMGVMGDSGSVMDPDGPVTRQETFATLARALDLDDGAVEDLTGFEDADDVAGWALGPVAAMVKAGYVGGSGGRLDPTGAITRAEFAQVMYNTFAFYIREEGEVSEIPEGNIVINVPGVTLKDVTVTGDLILGDGVGDGDVRLENVTIEGCVNVRGGGENSVYFEDCTLDLVKVNKQFGGEGVVPLRLVFLGSTSTTVRIEVVSLNCDVLIEGTVGSIIIIGKYAYLTVSGKVNIVTVDRYAAGTVINNKGTINILNAGTDTTVNGGGVKDIRGDGKVTDDNGKKVVPVTPEPVYEPYYPPYVPTPAPDPTAPGSDSSSSSGGDPNESPSEWQSDPGSSEDSGAGPMD